MIKKKLSLNINCSQNKTHKASTLKAFEIIMAFAVITATLITETTIISPQQVHGQNASGSNSTNSSGAAAKTTITKLVTKPF